MTRARGRHGRIDTEQVKCQNLKAISIFCLLAPCRYKLLQKDKDQIMQEYKENLQQLQSKFDVDRDFLKQEQAQVCCQV